MKTFIPYSVLKLMFFFLLIACNSSERFSEYTHGVLEHKSGKKIQTIVAVTREQQSLGLSHTKPEEFRDDQGMLFPSSPPKIRQFWMPETYFDLDVFFLNQDLMVVDIHRSLKHFKHKTPKSSVPLSISVLCSHVLEMKASSPIAKKIKIGDFLVWSGDSNLQQIAQDIR